MPGLCPDYARDFLRFFQRSYLMKVLMTGRKKRPMML